MAFVALAVRWGNQLRRLLAPWRPEMQNLPREEHEMFLVVDNLPVVDQQTGVGEEGISEVEQETLTDDEALPASEGTSHMATELEVSIFATLLPPETILDVADFLESEDRIRLGLTCWHMYLLLGPRTDMALRQVPYTRRVRFLQQLEPEVPEHLTCRGCARMFQWRRQSSNLYCCPGCGCTVRRGFDRLNRHDNCRFTREMVDLIFRARKRGLLHGIPASILDTDERAFRNVVQKNETRWVNGRLFLLSWWKTSFHNPQTSNPTRLMSIEAGVINALGYPYCSHSGWHIGWNTWRIWHLVFDVVFAPAPPAEIELARCCHCATDVKLYILRVSGALVQLELKIWRDLGDGTESDEFAQQVFLPRACLEIDPDTLFRRDLQRDFEAAPATSVVESRPQDGSAGDGADVVTNASS